MEIRSVILFIIFGHVAHATDKKDSKNSVVSVFDNSLIYNIGDIAEYVTRKLADFNDRHLGSSEWGKTLAYNEMKPKLLENSEARGLKKMSMAMMPLIFHVGATSTWMLITSIMAVKSVAIGLLLLVFKIATSSAKVASFFTTLKSKSGDHHHDVWPWAPAHSPHGHVRSLSLLETPETPEHGGWSSYTPEWNPSDGSPSVSDYKTIPTFSENTISQRNEELDIDESEPPIVEKAERKYFKLN